MTSSFCFRFAFRAAAPVLAAAGLLVGFSSCGRAPVEVSEVAPTPDPQIARDAETERHVRAELAKRDRIIEQQLANRRAAADVRGVGLEIQNRLIRDVQAREGQGGEAAAETGENRFLLAQAGQPTPTPSPSPTPSPTPGGNEAQHAPLTESPKTDPKFQEPPPEDKSDSMKPSPSP